MERSAPSTGRFDAQHHADQPGLPERDRVPLTPAAMRELQHRADRLEAALEPVRAASRLRVLDCDREAPTSVPDAELHLVAPGNAAQRTRTSEVVVSSGAAVVSCSVVIRDEDDLEESYVLVAPGEPIRAQD